VNGIRSAYFSWATIKLYYVCFYAARVILAANGIAIFYVLEGKKTGKPFSIFLKPGSAPHREIGQTHKVVWKVLERELPNNGLLELIDLEKAFDWMINLREEINYRNPKFPEPLVPSHFGVLSILGVETAVSTYVSDTSQLYTFDPAHAALAFPIECLKRAATALRRNSIHLAAADWDHIAECMNKAALPPLLIPNLLGQRPV
jgi:hypothetical protein